MARRPGTRADTGNIAEMIRLSRMKTTIDLDDDLLAAVKARAERLGTTMRAVVADALQRVLSEDDVDDYRLELPTTRGRRPPRIDVNANAEIDAYLDAR